MVVNSDPVLPRLAERTYSLPVVIVVALLAVGIGVFAGLQTPWGTKQPQVKEGAAMRANAENGLILFDAADGTQMKLDSADLWWVSSSEEGMSDPPCLQTPLERVQVEVAYVTVARPGGGSFPRPVWVRCP